MSWKGKRENEFDESCKWQSTSCGNSSTYCNYECVTCGVSPRNAEEKSFETARWWAPRLGGSNSGPMNPSQPGMGWAPVGQSVTVSCAREKEGNTGLQMCLVRVTILPQSSCWSQIKTAAANPLSNLRELFCRVPLNLSYLKKTLILSCSQRIFLLSN